MIDESCRWTRVGYEIMMPDNGTDKKVVVTFTDEEKEKQSEAEYAEVIRERDNLILTISGLESPFMKLQTKYGLFILRKKRRRLPVIRKRN